MTLDDVQSYRRVAYLPLPNGALLGYRPDDGRVRILAYPHRPEEWDRLPILHEDVPRQGWLHTLSCGCSLCRSDSSDDLRRAR